MRSTAQEAGPQTPLLLRNVRVGLRGPIGHVRIEGGRIASVLVRCACMMMSTMNRLEQSSPALCEALRAMTPDALRDVADAIARLALRLAGLEDPTLDAALGAVAAGKCDQARRDAVGHVVDALDDAYLALVDVPGTFPESARPARADRGRNGAPPSSSRPRRARGSSCPRRAKRSAERADADSVRRCSAVSSASRPSIAVRFVANVGSSAAVEVTNAGTLSSQAPAGDGRGGSPRSSAQVLRPASSNGGARSALRRRRAGRRR